MNWTRIKGIVRGMGQFYTGGPERLEIHVKNDEAADLPFKEGERVPVTLVVEGKEYRAGLRATSKNEYVWISPDLIVIDGEKQQLAKVLGENGFEKNDRVILWVSGTELTLERE